MTVTLTPVTSPLIPAFCFDPIVWRAARVARAFAVAAARCSPVSGVFRFLGERP
jgi:hypothetical protein